MNKHSKFNRFFQKNSPTILTIIGSAGVAVTAAMSARDTVKAMKRIQIAEDIQKIEYIEDRPLTKKQKIKIAIPCYIPTIITGLSTILCILGANKLNKDTQKSLTSAYMLLDQTYREYKNSVTELYGEEGNKNVIKHIADKKIVEMDINDEPDMDIFFDFFSLQFFNSTLDKIREAEEAANEMLKMHGYFSLATWYSFVGADMNAADEMLGWSLGAGKLYGYDSIKIDVEECVKEDGSKHYVIDFVDRPTDNYLDL